MIPLGRMPVIAPEALAAGNVRPDRPMKLTCAGGKNICLKRAAGGLQRPDARPLIEACILDFRIEDDVAAKPVFADDGFKIGLDVPREDEFLRPVGTHVEGKLVHVQRHVAGTARIGVLAPGAADFSGLFIDGEIRETCFLELDRGADAGNARAENGNARAISSARL